MHSLPRFLSQVVWLLLCQTKGLGVPYREDLGQGWKDLGILFLLGVSRLRRNLVMKPRDTTFGTGIIHSQSKRKRVLLIFFLLCSTLKHMLQFVIVNVFSLRYLLLVKSAVMISRVILKS